MPSAATGQEEEEAEATAEPLEGTGAEDGLTAERVDAEMTDLLGPASLERATPEELLPRRASAMM